MTYSRWLKAAPILALSLCFAQAGADPLTEGSAKTPQGLGLAGGMPRTPAPAPTITSAPMSQESIAYKSKTAPAPTPPPLVYPPYGRTVTLAEAKAILAAAEAEAFKNNWQMVITIVEPNGAVVLSEKMDGAQYGSVSIAEKKAVTAATFRRPTAFFQEAVKNGTLNSIFTGAMALEGGELIIIEDHVVGAIGVSGAMATQDGLVARAGASLFAPPPPPPPVAVTEPK